MKKVRRRVVEREGQDQNEEQTGNQTTLIHAFDPPRAQNFVEISEQQQIHNQDRIPERVTHGHRSEIRLPEPDRQTELKGEDSNFRNQTIDEASVSPQSLIKPGGENSRPLVQASQIKQIEVKPAEDEKKSRIEMLKQKYLKKAPEVKIQIPKQVQNLKTPTIQKPKPAQIVPQLQRDQKLSNFQPPINKKQQLQVKSEALTSKNPLKHQVYQKLSVKQPQQKIQTIEQVQQGPISLLPEKVEDKKPFKVPPPPKGNAHKTKPPPPPVIKASHQHLQQEVFVKDPVKEISIDNTTFAPVSFINEPVEDSRVNAKPIFVPPPPIKANKPAPKSVLVQELRSKKGKKEELNSQILEQSQNQNQYQAIINILPQKEIQKSIVSQNTKVLAHADHAEKQLKGINFHEKEENIRDQITNWINAPSKILAKFIPNIEEIFHATPQSFDKDYKFTSKNQSFNSAIGCFLNEFVLKSKGSLSEGQKSATYALSIEYFSHDAQRLSAQLLLIIIKLGGTYLEKYISIISKNLNEDALLLLQNKVYFSSNELSSFLNLILQKRQVSQSELIYLLLLSPNEKILNTLTNQNLKNVKYLISLLSCLNLLKKQSPNLTNVYLKLISSLMESIPDDQSIVEMVLKHVSELQTNEKCYQLHKQIKLKLISLISTSQKPQKQELKSSASEGNKDNGDGGLFGYWNKAVDKIKTATTQLTEVKAEKSKTVVQEEVKQEEITYDPVLKRYLINGKVPDDEGSRPADSDTPKPPPPPPPPSKAVNKPAPPPLPGKKPRVATNRYA